MNANGSPYLMGVLIDNNLLRTACCAPPKWQTKIVSKEIKVRKLATDTESMSSSNNVHRGSHNATQFEKTVYLTDIFLKQSYCF